MSKERELLERALGALDGGPLYRVRLQEEIRKFLASEEPVGNSDKLQRVVSSKMERTFIRLTDEEIREILGPFAGDPISGYTRKLFDEIQDKLEKVNERSS